MVAIGSLTEDRQELVERNLGLSYAFAKRYTRKYPHLSREEVLSSAQLGLCRAASLWTKDLYSNEFMFFAWYWMQCYTGNDQRKAWLCVSRYKQFPAFVDVACPDDDDEEPIDWRSLSEKLHAALDGMKPKKREIVKMLVDGMSVTQIANRMGCSKQNVSAVIRAELGKIGPMTGRLPQLTSNGKPTP